MVCLTLYLGRSQFSDLLADQEVAAYLKDVMDDKLAQFSAIDIETHLTKTRSRMALDRSTAAVSLSLEETVRETLAALRESQSE